MVTRHPTVYIISNKRRTVLYIGVTGWPQYRIRQHRMEIGGIFAAQNRCRHLVYYEHHRSMMGAIIREKQLKKWKRSWKMRLIRKSNPELEDLWHQIR